MKCFKLVGMLALVALLVSTSACLSPQSSSGGEAADEGRSLASVGGGDATPSPNPSPTPTPTYTVIPPAAQTVNNDIGVIGFNGEGFIGNYSHLTDAQKDELAQWLKDLGRPVAVRFPGGGSSRFHHPNSLIPGWGNRKQEIVWYFDCFAPTDDSAANKQSELDNVDNEDSVAPQSYLKDIVDLSDRMNGNLRIIYVANVMIYPSNLNTIGTNTTITNCGSYQLPTRGTAAYSNLVTLRVNEAVSAMKYLVDNGVQVVGVEGGNEVYGALNWDFDEYKARFEPIFTAIKADLTLADVKRSIVSGNMKNGSGNCGINAHNEGCWNNAISTYTSANYEAVSIHPYINESDLSTEVSNAFGLMTTRAIGVGTLYSDINDSFLLAYTQLMSTGVAVSNGMVDSAKAKYSAPSKEVWVTEWNTKHYGNSTPGSNNNFVLNTLANGAWQFYQLLNQRTKLGFMLMHNGVSNALFGAISQQQGGRCDLDPPAPWVVVRGMGIGTVTSNSFIRRVGYWATKLAADYLEPVSGKEIVPTQVDSTAAISFSSTGTYRFYFTNLQTQTYTSVAYTPSVVFAAGKNLKVNSKKVRYVSGSYLYSSSGWAGFMSCNNPDQNGTYEIGGIQEVTNSSTVPVNSFGYIEYSITKNVGGTGNTGL